jgi:hypothetical protein
MQQSPQLHSQLQVTLYANTSVLYEHVPIPLYSVSLLLCNIKHVLLHIKPSQSSSHFFGQTSYTEPSHNEAKTERKVTPKRMTSNVYTPCFGQYILPNQHPINIQWHHLWQQQNLPPFEFPPKQVTAIKQHLFIINIKIYLLIG